MSDPKYSQMPATGNRLNVLSMERCKLECRVECHSTHPKELFQMALTETKITQTLSWFTSLLLGHILMVDLPSSKRVSPVELHFQAGGGSLMGGLAFLAKQFARLRALLRINVTEAYVAILLHPIEFISILRWVLPQSFFPPQSVLMYPERLVDMDSSTLNFIFYVKLYDSHWWIKVVNQLKCNICVVAQACNSVASSCGLGIDSCKYVPHW